MVGLRQPRQDPRYHHQMGLKHGERRDPLSGNDTPSHGTPMATDVLLQCPRSFTHLPWGAPLQPARFREGKQREKRKEAVSKQTVSRTETPGGAPIQVTPPERPKSQGIILLGIRQRQSCSLSQCLINSHPAWRVGPPHAPYSLPCTSGN